MTDEQDKAEYEHCALVLDPHTAAFGECLLDYRGLLDLLMRERQAVRAETQAQLNAANGEATAYSLTLDQMSADLAHVTSERDTAREQRDTYYEGMKEAKAQLERVTQERDTALALHDAALKALHGDRVYIDALKAQLQTLRAAAEGAVRSLEIEPDEDGDTQTSAYLRLKYTLDSIEGETK